ncbi:MAG: polyphosphate polymerase domain-containing protein [Bacteroidota bacterium]|nr:polyphosphate polymerase domain-containing protein [Bacteroidota bacterium]
MEGIQNILSRFEPINLQQMDAVKLMDRTDRKFAFLYQQLPQVLQELEPFYHVLEIANTRVSRYRSLYFDDDKLALYHQHHNGRCNRVKVRHRTYVESNLAFWEVKIKNNKGRTIKNRMPLAEVPLNLSSDLSNFVLEKVGFNAQALQATVWVNYQRITLVNKHSPERLTIDINLQIEHPTQQLQFPNFVIAEVKQPKRSYSPFFNLAKHLKIREGSLSKYCLAISLIHPKVKQNNFKRKIKQLSTLLH